MNSDQYEKARQFQQLHQQEGCFLMPNCWDAGTAKMLVDAGFKAIATTSAGVAFSLGHPDNVFCSQQARLGRNDMLIEVGKIARAVSVPVSADLEAGFGEDPAAVGETIRLAIAAGAVAGNIEDYRGDKEEPLYELQESVDRIVAAKRAISDSEIPFTLVARSDAVLAGFDNGLSVAIERCNRFLAAGADCLFVPGVGDEAGIRTLVQEIDGPISVVMGLSGSTLKMEHLRDLGVRRVSIGGSLVRAVYLKIQEAAREMFEQGTFNYAQEQVSQAELNAIFEKKL